jgi:hypothetical protein
MSLFVAPHPTTTLDDLASRRYDALLCSHGYETRSRTIAERLGGEFELKAAGYCHGHQGAFEENRKVIDALGGEVLEFEESEFEPWVRSWLSDDRLRSVAVDISSMSRPRIAAVVHAVTNGPNTNLVVDFLYVPQRYSGAPVPVDATTALEPVTPAFAGWDADVERPLVMIFGLGFEPIRAAGAIDELEPTLSIPYFPRGADDSFIADVERANESVLRLQDVAPARSYELADPFRCFAELDAWVSHYQEEESRPLFLPLGPKIFALLCMLVAVAREPVTPVWRISPGPLEEAVDHQPEDMLVTVRVSPKPIVPDTDS